MADELIDIVDEQGKPTGKTIMKSEAHKIGALHRVAHLILYNSKHQFLSQQRSIQKNIHPGYWDISAAGHIGAGEDPQVAICRETQEEIGICISQKDLKLITTIRHTKTEDNLCDEEFYFVYAAFWDGNISDLTFQESEVANAQWLDPYAVPENSDYDTIRDYLPELADKIF
jgi:isopentenyldiphosphate isomerase